MVTALDGNTLFSAADLPAFGARWPIDDSTPRVTNPFAARYATGFRHRGIDLGIVTGTPVRSCAAGSVASVNGVHPDYGLHVLAYHGLFTDTGGRTYGIRSLYAHLNSITVRLGQSLSPGTLIGYSGNTGLSTGPHLHWEIRRDAPGSSGGWVKLAPNELLRKAGDEGMTPEEKAAFARLEAKVTAQGKVIAEYERYLGDYLPNLAQLGAMARYGGLSAAEDSADSSNTPEKRATRRGGQFFAALQLTDSELEALPDKLDVTQELIVELANAGIAEVP